MILHLSLHISLFFQSLICYYRTVEGVIIMRINKLLSNYGYCSRKKANTYIKEGAVRVNGILATEGQWVTEEDEILFHGKVLHQKPAVFFLYHKPPGIICTMDEEIQDGLVKVLPPEPYMFPVGRLDKASEGLLLLTNDGDLAQRIMNGDNTMEKEYHVWLKSPISDEILEKLSQGVPIGIGFTKPCKVIRLEENAFSITITEGMNRQIRRMVGYFGHEVVILKRVRILNLLLSGLPQGQLREATTKEIEKLHALTKI